ncbi:MAG: ABC transporter ATP-binding protein [Candidatus Margulisbacteria bacterium]|jgi:putative ABC transport system ATP-binding protein|nr:ABC transporter ATP-binding protein [Candidatus Margulisiibacteriota bacterium]
MAFIEAKNLTKIYTRGAEKIYALHKASFTVERGAIIAVTGASGSGKTTLVNVLGCLDNPTSGSLVIDGQTVFEDKVSLSESALTKVRRKIFGYVFQKFFLLPTLTVKENILLPAVFQPGLRANSARLTEILQMLGLDKRANHLPGQLSGGEMQRTAIARALINNPSVLIADEPTGNLDSRRSEEIKNLLLELNQKQNLTIILVTHNPELAKIGNQTLELKDGVIQ